MTAPACIPPIFMLFDDVQSSPTYGRYKLFEAQYVARTSDIRTGGYPIYVVRIPAMTLSEQILGYQMERWTMEPTGIEVTPFPAIIRMSLGDPDKYMMFWTTHTYLKYDYQSNWIPVLGCSRPQEISAGEYIYRTANDNIHTTHMLAQIQRQTREIARAYHDSLPANRYAARAPAPAAAPKATQRIPSAPFPVGPPHFVAQALLRDAVRRGQSCPISLNDFTDSPCAVTNCFHIFEGSALEAWLSGHKDCPVCKAPVKGVTRVEKIEVT